MSKTSRAGNNINFTSGSPTSITSNSLPITLAGTVQLDSTTDLTINRNGGNVEIDSLFGTARNFTVNANVGNLTFTQIGASGFNLDNVNLTAENFYPDPASGVNVFADNLNVFSPNVLTISTAQTIGNVTYNSPVVFLGNIEYTCGAAGTITFNQSVDANTAGVDSVSFDFYPCTGSLSLQWPCRFYGSSRLHYG